jgi:hypothetical protein
MRGAEHLPRMCLQDLELSQTLRFIVGEAVLYLVLRIVLQEYATQQLSL